MNQLFQRKRLLVAIGVLLYSSAFIMTFTGFVPSPRIDIAWETHDKHPYMPTYDANEGPQLALIYIGSSTCGAANQPTVPASVKKLKRLLQQRARSNGYSFTAIGVAKEWVAGNGLAHLEKFGTFDQIITGGSSLNEGALKYMWQDLPGEAATPQVVVLKRNVVTPEGSGFYGTTDEEVLLRKIGVVELKRWADQDAPLHDAYFRNLPAQQ